MSTQTVDDFRGASTLPEPPLDRGPMIVGHLPEFMWARGPLLARLYRVNGPCFRMRMGLETPVVMAGPEMAEFTTKDAGRILHAGPSNMGFVREFGGTNMMLGADMDPHFHRRRNLMGQFTPGAVMKMVPRFAAVTVEMASAWSTGAPLDLLPCLKRLVTRQTGLVLAGRDAEAIYDDLCRFFDLAVAVCFAQVPRPVMKLLGYAEARERVLGFASSILDDRAAMPADARPGDLIDAILAAREPDGSPLDRGEQVGLVLAPFIGGLDTVSHTLSFLLYEVLTRPELQARCQREADAVFDGDTLDPARVRNLETIAATVSETLRVHPIAPVGQRVAAESFDFAGYRIQKGTKLLLGWSVGNQVASRYAHPERFDVDRFLAPRNESTSGIGAFGFGPHKCIGAKLGEVQLAVTLAALLRKTTMRLDPPGARLRTTSYTTLKPVGLRVRFERRAAPERAAS
ncbi:putative cytochrome P450 hydroxylase [Minicystis rosea]|nr:putative cytochrome P450 hydroxylase [Minicystis rosea]